MSDPKVVLLGLDAFDPRLARELAAAGKLPAIANLLDTAARVEVRHPYAFFVGSVWTTLLTGRSPVETGLHCWEQIEAGTYNRRLTDSRQVDGSPFWSTLSEGGRRVAVIDFPHSWVEGLNGIQVCEWGCHDRHFGFATWPAELAAEIEQRYGLHPVFGHDAHTERHFAPDDEVHRAGNTRTADEQRALADDLLAGAELKARLSADLLGREDWDLFVSIFGESHAAGHQFWHLHDPAHVDYDPDLAAALGDPVERVYRRLDAAVAAHVEALAGTDATLLVLLSHGMTAHYDADHLLDEILHRLDRDDHYGAGGGRASRALRAAYSSAPRPLRRAARRPAAALVRRATRHRDLVHAWIEAEWDDWTEQAYFASPNNTVFGGIRINLRSREPKGIVEPGAEFDATCERLGDRLCELVNVDTGGPVVDEVVRTDERYERRELDELPDLLVAWNHDAPVETVWSPRTGIVHGPYLNCRTGDHRAEGLGLLLATGPGMTPGERHEISTAELAEALARRLGVEPRGADENAVAWLTEIGAGSRYVAAPEGPRGAKEKPMRREESE
jgi:predicted AlkP superfamily phosphohydrolase/phosphomutase